MAGRKSSTRSTVPSKSRKGTSPLAGKIAVITGGSRGLGRALAAALASHGARVVITGRDESALAVTAASISRNKKVVFARHCDVRRPESVDTLFSAIRRQFGRIDILINNAGIAHPLATADKLSVETWIEVIETNLTGLFLVTRSALPLMHPGGSIINNLSIAAKTVFPGMSAYNASKHGALGFTDSIREELRSREIRVISLVPGATDTAIWEQFWPEAPREKMMSPESIAEAVLCALSLPENATVSQLEITPTGGAL